MPIAVTLTSDFICPWCFIGENRLAQAVARLPDDLPVVVTYLPFELNPDMPPEGRDRRAYRSAKFGSWARSQALDAQVVAVGMEDGLAFNYDRVARTPNTMLAHRLMWLAGREGADQTALARKLFVAYFTEGRDVSDPDFLRGLAAEAGLGATGIAAVLTGGLGAAETRALIADAYRRGIEGVPLFEIGGMALSGAQPVAVIEQALRRAAMVPTAVLKSARRPSGA